ncbi:MULTISPECIES: translesion DNA synthesis-associated protein ImuA [Pseudomonas]|uniref:Translesion DNA synthesis-associated protein ImuA n=1 Tax=Pseudomonas quercus TaxID=2722792 RepID=A0ABX0YBR5_9PSED|nr:translesion DNA synthesis-associated protein ImuA [Pseudomonas sp. LY10J]MBF7141186.1 translesion DNA synthesis-associated protein ImuA [Pseudomonas sp. LY10J]NJO99721.1 translesion DNA synthesis-associated protein ImuA [Pseudomonas quercus]
MSNTVVSLEGLLDSRRVWKGRSASGETTCCPVQPTGHAQLDSALPLGGWPANALSEILIPATGSGELNLLWPTLARLTAAGERVVLVSPPLVPYPQAWLAAGVNLQGITLVSAQGKEALWAAEQCLRSGSCAAVVCWVGQADERALRRLQVAAETGQALGFALRGSQAAINPSPAALRIAITLSPARWTVLKCRGGLPSARSVAWSSCG